MNRLTIAAQTIKDSVSAVDVGNAIGLEIRHGRCQCPFHGGKDYNCVLYRGNRGWYCHVCKAGGDVLSFARQYYKFGFKDCIAWFNDTFHLGLEIDREIDPEKQREAEKALQRRKKAIELQAFRERMQFGLALAAEQIVDRLEEARDRHRPRTYGEWDPVFYMAVKTLPEARRFEEECAIRCVKEEK